MSENKTLALLCAQAAQDKKATRTLVFDMKGRTDICSFQVICSGENERHTKAICENIEFVTKSKLGQKPLAIEGKQSGHWVLLDYGSVVVHVFFQHLRDYYALEQLWSEAESIPLSPSADKPASASS